MVFFALILVGSVHFWYAQSVNISGAKSSDTASPNPQASSTFTASSTAEPTQIPLSTSLASLTPMPQPTVTPTATPNFSSAIPDTTNYISINVTAVNTALRSDVEWNPVYYVHITNNGASPLTVVSIVGTDILNSNFTFWSGNQVIAPSAAYQFSNTNGWPMPEIYVYYEVSGQLFCHSLVPAPIPTFPGTTSTPTPTPSQTPSPTPSPSTAATFSPTPAPSSSNSVNVQFEAVNGGEASFSTENVHTGARAVKLVIPTSAGEGSCAVALYSYRAAFSSVSAFSIETSYFNATPRFVIYLDTNGNGSPDVFLLSDYQLPSNGQWNATTGGLRWGWSEANSDLSGYGQSWQPLSYWKNKYPNASVLFLGVALQYDVVVTNNLNGVTYDGLGQPLYADELMVNGVTYAIASSASPTAAPTVTPSSTASVPLSPTPTVSPFFSPTATATLSPLPSSSPQPSASLPSSSPQPSASLPSSSPQPSPSSQLELYEVISGLVGAIVVLAVVAVALLLKKKR